MKLFTVIASLVVAVSLSFPVDAKIVQSLPGKMIYQSKSSKKNILNKFYDKSQEISDVAKMSSLAAEEYKPDFELPFSDTYGDLDGPDGEIWYYTANLTYEYKQMNEYWTDYFLRHYVFTIYDNNGVEVGRIEDDMHYTDDEVRAVYIDLLPVVTKNFFNDDNAYEIAVGLAINTTTPGKNHYRTVAYTLGGEKDGNGNNTIIATIPEMVADVLDLSNGGEERYMMAIVNSNLDITEGEGKEETAEEFWNRQMSYENEVVVFDKVDSQNNIHEVLRNSTKLHCLPGEQENTPSFMSMTNQYGGFYVFSKYKESLYNPYNSPSDPDMSQRENNTLVIEMYKFDGQKFVPYQTTEYPFVKDNAENVIASYYSIGNFRYNGDVLFNNDGSADFYMTKQNKLVGNDESYVNSYYLVKADGKLDRTIFESCAYTQMFSSVKGYPEQCLFITYDNDYVFHFVDLPEAKEVGSMTNMFMIDDFSDPEYLLANCDRTAYGDSYRYAFEMSMPDEDESGLKMRVAWFDNKLKFIDYDYVNMGKDIRYATLYLDGAVMQPDFYYKDKAGNREYMILLKRDTPAGIEEQLLVAQAQSEDFPDGKDIILLTPDSEKGILSSIIAYSLAAEPHLNISYRKTEIINTKAKDSLSLEVYKMPFGSDETGGVEDIIVGNGINFDGSVISAAGEINIYNLCGLKVASALNSLSADGLTSGVYIVTAAGETRKIFVK